MEISAEHHDPTHGSTSPDRFWSTANIGEATPDVLSPMCWSFWGPTMEAGARLAYADLGIMSKEELAVPTDHDQLLTAHFYGRPAMNLDRLRSLFDSIPGMTADDFERDICGEVRPGLPPEPNRGRTIHIAVRAPIAMVTAGRRVRRLAVEQQAWWTEQVLEGQGMDAPRRLLHDAMDRFREAFRAHVRNRFVLMALQAQLTDLAEGAGRPDLVMRVLGGMGEIAETDLADDLWQVGRNSLTIDEFVRRHGFHGLNEGNVASRSWREDQTAILQLASAMASRDDERRPRSRETGTKADRVAAITELEACLPRLRRPLARWLCRATARAVQSNEIGKAAFLMAIDGGRAATRAIGAELHANGVLDEVDDAFYLTADELDRQLPDDVGQLIEFRRERRNRFRRYELPNSFTGMPTPTEAGGDRDRSDDGPVVVTGVCGASGIVEGHARVILDPDESDPLEPGEILVCRFTDPSWAPTFTLADALVIDIGAAASHGAIVARELGVPCVIGTSDGTRKIRSGDLLRVDGDRGRVEILERAGTTTTATVAPAAGGNDDLA